MPFRYRKRSSVGNYVPSAACLKRSRSFPDSLSEFSVPLLPECHARHLRVSCCSRGPTAAGGDRHSSRHESRQEPVCSSERPSGVDQPALATLCCHWRGDRPPFLRVVCLDGAEESPPFG